MGLSLWLSNWREWQSTFHMMLAAWAVVALAVASAVVALPHYPCMVLAELTLLAPLLLVTIHAVVFPDMERSRWFGGAYQALAGAAIGCCLIWILWMGVRSNSVEKWTDWPGSFRAMVKVRTISWKMAFVAWALPAGLAAELAVMSVLCWIRKHQVEQISKSSPEEGTCQFDHVYVVNQVKSLALVVTLAAMALWLNASLNATGEITYGQERENMRDEVMALSFFSFAGIAGWMVYTVGPQEIAEAAEYSKAAKSVKQLAGSDWAKAAVLICLAPLLPLYLCLDLLRNVFSGLGTSAQTPRKTQWLGTVDADAVLGLVADWSWTSVVMKAQLISIAYVFVEVGCMKGTTVTLAYVNESLVSWPIYSVCIALFLIGLFLFLLPPTPGAPVYMVTGIVISASALRANMSFWSGVMLATCVGFAQKMSFTFVAQKCIGQPLASSLAVRRLVGVHTVEIRAIEAILSAPTFTMPKLVTLIGGPDWPVAVLCGILGLPAGQILLGISPVLLQSVFPCVLSGSLLYSAGENVTLKALAETSLAVAGILQLVLLVLSADCVQEVIEKDYDELRAPRDCDRDVLLLEEESAARQRAFYREVEWSGLPSPVRFLLMFGLVCAEASVLLLALPSNLLEKEFGAACFKPFGLMSSIETDLGGSVWAIVNPLGWMAIGFCASSMALLGVFYSWASYHVVTTKPGEEGLALVPSKI